MAKKAKLAPPPSCPTCRDEHTIECPTCCADGTPENAPCLECGASQANGRYSDIKCPDCTDEKAA